MRRSPSIGASSRDTSNRIHVGVRLRPFNEKEKASKETESTVWLLKDSCTILENSAVVEDTSNFFSQKEFIFDQVFSSTSKNSEVYEGLVYRVVKGFVDGFNGTLFAYGQTSSGKTHTLIGKAEDPGVTPLAIHDVFNLIRSAAETQFLLRASYFEIYNDDVSDLLSHEEGEFVMPSGSSHGAVVKGYYYTSEKLKVRESPEIGWFVEHLKEFIIRSPEEALALLAAGDKRKHVSETKMNLRSSRSHTIFRLILERAEANPENEKKKLTVVAALNLVDLAGSESIKKAGSSAGTMKEGMQINSSLLTLGTVIHKLSEGIMEGNKAKHIPFRNSTLTKVLRSSLGGNALTSVIANLSPALSNLFESRNTLLFSSRAARIVNRPERVKVEDEASLLSKYRREIEELKRKVAEIEEQGERELQLEHRLKQIQDLIRMSSKKVAKDQHGRKLLDNLIAVSSGLRTFDEVVGELCLVGTADFGRRSYKRQLSDVELQNLETISGLHQSQVVLEQGRESLVRTPPTPRHKKQENSTSTEGSQSTEDSGSYDQMRHTQIDSPSYLAQTSSSARKVQGSNNMKDDSGSRKKRRDTAESGVRKSGKNTPTVTSKHKKSAHSKTFLRAVSEGSESDDQTESGNSEGRKETQKMHRSHLSSAASAAVRDKQRRERLAESLLNKIDIGPGTVATAMAMKLQERCQDTSKKVKEVVELVEALLARCHVEEGKEEPKSGAKQQGLPTAEDVAQLQLSLKDLGKHVESSEEDAVIVVSEVLSLSTECRMAKRGEYLEKMREDALQKIENTSQMKYSYIGTAFGDSKRKDDGFKWSKHVFTFPGSTSAAGDLSTPMDPILAGKGLK